MTPGCSNSQAFLFWDYRCIRENEAGEVCGGLWSWREEVRGRKGQHREGGQGHADRRSLFTCGEQGGAQSCHVIRMYVGQLDFSFQQGTGVFGVIDQSFLFFFFKLNLISQHIVHH